MTEFDEAITIFCEQLDNHGIRYVVGGSVASGVWGEPRQTHDVDVEVWLGAANAGAFLEAFKDPYLTSEYGLNEALQSPSDYPMAQVLQTELMLKFDCFLQRHEDEFASACFDRSVLIELLPGRPIRVASAEEILIQKLRWFELGNRVSERQWRDLKGIVRVAPNLDWSFIAIWVDRFGLANLLLELRDAESP